MAILLLFWLLPLGAYVAYTIYTNRKKQELVRLEEAAGAPDEQSFYAAAGELMMQRIEGLGLFQRYLPERKVEPDLRNSYDYWRNQYLPAQRQSQKNSIFGTVYLYVNLAILASGAVTCLVLVKWSEKLIALFAITLPTLAVTAIAVLAIFYSQKHKQAVLDCCERIDRRFWEYAALEQKGTVA